jgi:formate hydrogenlyase transcriptional activator
MGKLTRTQLIAEEKSTMSTSQSSETDRTVADEDLDDLFEEAPVAYVHEDMNTRFIRANRAAREILGISAEEVSRTLGTSLVVDTPEARQNVREALERLRSGGLAEHRVLELRRKDNGERIWVQWWSKPAPSGAYTRSMFIDITQQVLLEQERARLSAQNLYLQEEIKSEHNFEEIIGATAGLARVMAKVTRVAATDASVLITGESGTGKELIARALHSRSTRAEKPFIKVNCAALPVGLVESELFGHERGAFSGAIHRRIGRFELAHTGTIFLDEIGEMPLDVQVKLLRVLQEHEFERIGNSHPITSDVRVLAATNRDLQKSMRDGGFRPDLFYRLNVFPIALPPLRERIGDLPLLTHFFVQKHAGRLARRIDAIEAESIRRLMQYPWPGNIRELENVIERALILSGTAVLSIDPDLLGIEENASMFATQEAAIESARSAHPGNDLDSIQREHILKVLREVDWVIEGADGAAVRLGLKPGTLRHRMKKLGIKRD